MLKGGRQISTAIFNFQSRKQISHLPRATMSGEQHQHEQVSLFRSKIINRRFDDETLAALEISLVSKDVKSSLEVRSVLENFLRPESLRILQEISDKKADHKLTVLDFFVRAFALIGDFESCLALQYEALVFRELKSAGHPWLQVNFIEWMNFAEQAMARAFYSIAAKACDKALMCVEKIEPGELRDGSFNVKEAAQRVLKLKDIAVVCAGSCSVQAKTVVYLKKKTTKQSKQPVCPKETQPPASTLFRKSIGKRNVRKFHEQQQLKLM